MEEEKEARTKLVSAEGREGEQEKKIILLHLYIAAASYPAVQSICPETCFQKAICRSHL